MPRPPSSPHARAPLVLGVLGGIASGKSAVARLLAEGDGQGQGELLDADELAHQVLETPEVLERVRAAFGPGVVGSDGRADRAALAQRVFADPRARARLEAWIHPAVRVRIAERLAAARESGLARVVLDVPLLLESDERHHLTEVCDALVFVDSDARERERRALADRGWSPGELARREASQLPLDVKRARADHVISNDGDLDDLRRAVSRLLGELESRPEPAS